MGAMPLKDIYIVLEDMDLDWSKDDVDEFDLMWKKGIPIDLIAKNFGREVDEIAVLVMDRARRGSINPRYRGVFGGAEQSKQEETQNG